ncbi:uncharacterized protein LOC143216162 isoform X2 [Lasioglossum baleicum]|uniref:uncharacterized protein LOC143216162 isoform X2 n=1 Tax=Lasioglossum baleicum TaxID=434251 RepID=UPI003FCC974A
MSIDASFYKNVFLLMQAIPPSFECTKHFKQGMFDKSNPAGFIHISHYLLSIYDPKKFQKIVPWPILNKRDETQYRLKVKEYLDVIAAENADMNFPSILMIHIMRAAGTRFLNIMWKLSQISLRSYIARHYDSTLLQAPDTGATSNISRKHITNINLERDSTISKLFEETKLAINSFKHYKQYYCSILKNLQTAVFVTTEIIRKCIEVAPVNRNITKRLADSKDTEIIDLWKANIDANIASLYYTNSYLQIDAQVIQQVFNNNTKHLGSGLYVNGCLGFYSLLLVLNEILKQTECCQQIDSLSDLSNCAALITEQNKLIKSMEEKFQNFILAVADASRELQSSLPDKTFHLTIQNDDFYSMCQKILREAPKLEFCFNESINDEKLAINKLLLSPEKGKYKHLFVRYKKDKSSSLKRSLSTSLFTNCTQSKPTDWMTPKRLTLSSKTSSPSNNKTVSPRYSKLFSPRSLTKHYTGNRGTSSPIRHVEKSPKSNNQIIDSKVDLDTEIKNIYVLSSKIMEIATSISKSLKN